MCHVSRPRPILLLILDGWGYRAETAHNAIALASHNKLFVQIVASFGPLMEVAVPAAWRTRATEEQRTAMVEHHRALARAIADKDAAAAGAAMHRHFDESIGDVMRAMSAP